MKLTKFVKHGLCILTSVAVMGTLVGCGGQVGSMNKGKLVKIAVYVSSQTPAFAAMREVFRSKLEELTDGKYDIQVYDSRVLGSKKATCNYTRNGIVEMCVMGTPMWSETPATAIPDFPSVFRGVEHAKRCHQGQLGSYTAEELEADQPVTLMSWFPNGARAFPSNKKLVELDDSKGQKLRMPNNPIHVKLAEGLGANMVIMDTGEVLTALEQGVADGQDNPLSTVKDEGWYEVQDYTYDTNHIVTSLELFARDQFWDSIDEADREIFRQVADEALDYAWDLYIDQLAGDKRFVKDNGLTMTDLLDEYREVMKIKIQPVYDHLDEEYEQVGAIRKMIEEIK